MLSPTLYVDTWGLHSSPHISPTDSSSCPLHSHFKPSPYTFPYFDFEDNFSSRYKQNKIAWNFCMLWFKVGVSLSSPCRLNVPWLLECSHFWVILKVNYFSLYQLSSDIKLYVRTWHLQRINNFLIYVQTLRYCWTNRVWARCPLP